METEENGIPNAIGVARMDFMQPNDDEDVDFDFDDLATEW